jgi:thioredoxin-like negative regulator of GroEL
MQVGVAHVVIGFTNLGILGPILESEVAESKSAVLIKVDIDSAPKIAEEFQITSLPTVMAFINGKVVDSFVGSRNKAFVKSFIAKLQQK